MFPAGSRARPSSRRASPATGRGRSKGEELFKRGKGPWRRRYNYALVPLKGSCSLCDRENYGRLLLCGARSSVPEHAAFFSPCRRLS